MLRIRDINDIVEAAGGTAAVIDLTGVGAPAISNWKARGEIPAAYWFVFMEALGRVPPRKLFGFKENGVK